MGLISMTKEFFNSFSNKENSDTILHSNPVYVTNANPFRTPRFSKGAICDSTVMRIAIDVSQMEFSHVKMDKNPTTEMDMKSGLNECFKLEANIDQTAKDFMQDVVFSMFDEGVVAIVPIDYEVNKHGARTDIYSMRTAKITRWMTDSVEVYCYNENTGRYEYLVKKKKEVAILPNPMYEILNSNNATLKRYSEKLRLVDTVDNKSASTKLDMIIQTPYSVRSEEHKKRASERRNDIESQLTNSKLGIAYIGAEEKVTQLSRSLENNLLTESQQLRDEWFNQLGISKAVFEGTATEAEMQYYYVKVIYVIADRICQEFERKFLTKTGRTQGQKIVYYSKPLRFVPASQIASMGDTFRRNRITTSNEIRRELGFRPADDPSADLLDNPNMPADQQMQGGENPTDTVSDEEASNILSQLDQEQWKELSQFIQSLVGEDVPPDQMADALDDEQFKMVIDKAKEMLGQTNPNEGE